MEKRRHLDAPDIACAICGGRFRIDQVQVLIDADAMHARCYEAAGRCSRAAGRAC